jgi:L-aspartate semialdehyde sulfurtransferase ferredoxin
MKKMKVLLRFPQERTGKPVTSHLIRDFDIDYSILSAHINPGMIGELTLELSGEEENLAAGVKFLTEQGVQVHMLSRTIAWDSDKCTHCGACTAVCPSEALVLDNNAQLSLIQDKCIVCELCLKACPLNVLSLNYAFEQ